MSLLFPFPVCKSFRWNFRLPYLKGKNFSWALLVHFISCGCHWVLALRHLMSAAQKERENELAVLLRLVVELWGKYSF